ncbi:amino acid adenylation domain-containing protein [Hyphococcus sp. DH-69]|uniref:amino acid adenylation domain-containing protein n=1 Tax=Hyphococcus formosus TaxID=3143534 RepID=UPI00398B244F
MGGGHRGITPPVFPAADKQRILVGGAKALGTKRSLTTKNPLTDRLRCFEKADPTQVDALGSPLNRPADRRQQERSQTSPPLPLSIAQRGIWIGEKIARMGSIFNIAEAIEVHGPIDPDLFEKTIRQLTQEAETMRVNIVEDAHGPRQEVRPIYRGQIPYKDFSEKADPDQAARDWMMEIVCAPLDLERDALWTTALAKLAPDRFYILQNAHHIILDGFAGGLIVRRMAEIYNCLLEGEEPPPNPFNPLRVLTESDASYRASKAFDRDRAYWLERLSDAPDPVSFAQGRQPTANGLARVSFTFSSDETAAVRDLAKAYSCSVPQLLIALSAIFISKTTGCRDLVFGLPVSARTKIARTVPGMAANGVLLRLKIKPNTTLKAVAEETAREVRYALRHQRYRFEDMRRDLGMTGQHDHIARIAVNIEPFDYDLRFGGAPCSAHNLANSSVEDMVLFHYDRGTSQGVRVDFDANPSLYSDDDLQKHKDRYARLLRSVLANSDSDLDEIELLDEAERDTLIALGRGPARENSQHAVFQQIEARAQEHPNAIAIRDDGNLITYKILLRRANAIAEALRTRNIGIGDIVALMLPRGEFLPSAMMAVNKVGAAFLPLDPADPKARLCQVLEDSGARAVIGCDQSIQETIPEDMPFLDVMSIKPGDGEDHATDEAIAADRPAYVIYTSGSTGVPKGAVLSHGGLINMAATTIEQFSLSPDDRVLSVASPAFDASILEIHAALSAGASLVVASQETVRAPSALAELMRKEQATMMLATPPLWDALVATREAPLQGFKAAVGGDVLTSRLAKTLHNLGAEVTNLYGPTEATVQTIWQRINEDNYDAPPIGRPIANTQIYILDDALQMLPAGIAGEICIAGAAVGLGYLNRPQLTAEKFVTGLDGRRLYRTGDLGRWRDDGALEFLGRRDSQLKVRGFRIEPGEVEAAFLSCDGVAAAHVRAVSCPQGGKRLAAYIAEKPGAQLDKAVLRNSVSQTLPAHLVPAAIFILDALPLNQAGKINRHALPTTDAKALKGYVAPRTPTEEKLTNIFAEMLGLEKVGVEDNFFDLGADSLTAVQLLIEIETQFSTKLSLVSLFDAPTIANLARGMDSATPQDPFGVVFPLRRAEKGTPLFCIHSIVGVSWSYGGLLRHLSDHDPVYGLQARRLADAAAPQPQSVDDMAQDYLNEIRAIQPHGPYRLLGWSLGGLAAHAIAARLEAEGEEVSYVGLLDAFPYAQQIAATDQIAGDLIDIALRFVNYAPEAMKNKPADMNALAEFLFQEFDVFSLPIISRAGLDVEKLRQQFQAVIVNGFEIARRYRPHKIKSDLTIFRATGDRHSGLRDVVENHNGAWSAYTTGHVTEHDVSCTHFTMMNAEPLNTIGPIIRRGLSAS